MFRRSREPIIPSRAALHGLRESLNEPIVRIDGFPVAPARSAIALFDSGYGELSLAVAVRSREIGDAAFFLYQQPIPGSQAIEESLDVGVTFAEALGFLFDDDVVAGNGDAGHAQAAAIWEGLLGLESAGAGAPQPTGAVFDPSEALAEPSGIELDLEAPDRGAATTVIAFGGDEADLDLGDELLELDEGSIFDEPLELELEDELPAEAAAPLVAPPPVAPAARRERVAAPRDSELPRTTLTKFRGPTVVERVEDEEVAADGEAMAAGGPGVSTLGRVAIVRRRVAGAENRPSGLIRLLGSF